MQELTSNAMGLLTAALLTAAFVSAQEAETLKDALAKGDASVAFSYRYELVDDDEFEKDAHASTLRTALGYRTLPYKGFSLFIQAQNVAPISFVACSSARSARSSSARSRTKHAIVRRGARKPPRSVGLARGKNRSSNFIGVGLRPRRSRTKSTSI